MGGDLTALADVVVRTARAEQGTTEHPPGSNDTKYGDAYGARGRGWSWCAIFVWWVLLHAAGYDMRHKGFRNPASCQAIHEDAAGAGWRRIDPARAQPGDLVLFDFGVVGPGDPANDADHVGICIRAPAGGQITCVEGNTSSGAGGSQSNGDGVYRRTRSLSLVKAVWRPNYSQMEDDMPLTADDLKKIGDLMDAKLKAFAEKLPAVVWEADQLDRPASWPPPAPKPGEQPDTHVHPASALERMLEKLDDAHAIVQVLGEGGVPAADVGKLAAALAPAVAAELARRLES